MMEIEKDLCDINYKRVALTKLKNGVEVSNNDIRNLAKIHFNQTKFTFLKQSKILFMPTIRTIDKKTGKVLVNS